MANLQEKLLKKQEELKDLQTQLEGIEKILNTHNDTKSRIAEIERVFSTNSLKSDLKKQQEKSYYHSYKRVVDELYDQDKPLDLSYFIAYPIELYKNVFTKKQPQKVGAKIVNGIGSFFKLLFATMWLATGVLPLFGAIGLIYHSINKSKADNKIKELNTNINKIETNRQEIFDRLNINPTLVMTLQQEEDSLNKQSNLKNKIIETKEKIKRLKNQIKNQTNAINKLQSLQDEKTL